MLLRYSHSRYTYLYTSKHSDLEVRLFFNHHIHSEPQKHPDIIFGVVTIGIICLPIIIFLFWIGWLVVGGSISSWFFLCFVSLRSVMSGSCVGFETL